MYYHLYLCSAWVASTYLLSNHFSYLIAYMGMVMGQHFHILQEHCHLKTFVKECIPVLVKTNEN